ncbi:capping complex subunit for YIEGIA [Robertmurraya sp. GLU-23]
MGKESSMKPTYDILAYLTSNKERVITGSPLVIWEKNSEELKELTGDLAKAMKADVVKMKNGDYLVIRV